MASNRTVQEGAGPRAKASRLKASRINDARRELSRTHLRCAIYSRKSTAAGLDKAFNSLDAQREACEAYVRSRALEGWEALPEDYSDGGFSGANTDRPGVQKLLDQVRRGQVDVVVVYKVDRLSRSLLDFVQVMELLNRHGVAFVSVTQHFSTADPVGRLTLNILMSFAEFEREMIADRIRDKMAAARRKGKWTGGKAPLGYIPKGGRLEVLEEEALWVTRIFGWYLEGASILEITQRLNAEGVPLKTAQTSRSQPWTKHLVWRILRNRMYLGEIACQGEFVPGEHPALVEVQAFDHVQRRLASGAPCSHGKNMGVSKNPCYLVRGTLRCGSCGCIMSSASTRSSGRLHRYYRCTTRDRQGRTSCATRQLPAEAIERFVVERLKEALNQGHHVGALRRVWGTNSLMDLTPSAQFSNGFDAFWGSLSLANRQRLVRLMVEEVRVDEGKGTLRLQLRDLNAIEADQEVSSEGRGGSREAEVASC